MFFLERLKKAQGFGAACEWIADSIHTERTCSNSFPAEML